jgi:alanine-synthesizing transaminase
MCGNKKLVAALARIKSYLDYGMFTPIQIAAITALEGPQDCVAEICAMYKERRDVLCDGLNSIGWNVEKPIFFKHGTYAAYGLTGSVFIFD